VESAVKPWERFDTKPAGPWQQYEHTTSQGQGSPNVTIGGELTWGADVQDSPNPAGVGTAARVGMVEDPQARMAAYSRARFPDDPNAAQRYGMLDGDVVYRADDGNVYRETGTLGNVAEVIGREALPFAGGVAGTVVGGPLGAGAGAAAGRAYQRLGGLAQGDQQSAGGNAFDIGLEGILSWASAKVGDFLGKKIANSRVARDLPRLSDPDTQRLVATAQQYGIQLTPAEATNLGSLIQRQTALGQGFDEASDTMRRFYGDRAEAITRAVDDFIGQTPGAYEAGMGGQQAASRVIENAVAERQAVAGPIYRSAVRPDNMVPTQTSGAMAGAGAPAQRTALGELLADPFMASQVQAVKGNSLYRMQNMDDASLPVLDQVKKNIDDMIKVAARAGENNKVRLLEQRRVDLVNATDDAFPEYANARAAFEQASPEVDALVNSRIGAVAGLEGERLAKAADMLIGGKGDPSRVAWARSQFDKAGRLDQWNTLTRQWLRDSFEKTRGSLAAGDAMAGAKWRSAIFGSQRDRDTLAAALGQTDYKALESLMEVLEAAGRVPKQQSITAFATEDAKRMAVEAAPFKSALRNIDISSPMAELRELLISKDVDAWRQTLAEAITSPGGVDELKRLRVLKGLNPRSEKAIQIATGFLGRAVGLGGGAVVSPTPPDIAPQMPQPARR
jgi:hypothetical protein